MEKEQILKKDWQLLNAYGTISQLAMLRTIMDNQAIIISHLKNIPVESVAKQMQVFEKENYSEISKKIENNIPDYSIVTKNYK